MRDVVPIRPDVLLAAAVVGEKDDEGILLDLLVVQLCEDTTNAAIHAFDHRGVNGHASGLPGFLRRIRPRSDGARAIVERRTRRAGRKCSLGLDHAYFHLPGESV